MALLVLGAVNVPKILPERPFRLLGDASYSLYLTQFCVIGPATRVLAPLASPNASFALVAALMVIACIVGISTYLLIEAPLTRALRELLEKNGSERTSAAAPEITVTRN